MNIVVKKNWHEVMKDKILNILSSKIFTLKQGELGIEKGWEGG